jgi:hypothetical protein
LSASKPCVEGTRKELTVVAVVPVVVPVVPVVPVVSVVVVVVVPQAQMPNIIVAASISDITFFIIKFSP